MNSRINILSFGSRLVTAFETFTYNHVNHSFHECQRAKDGRLQRPPWPAYQIRFQKQSRRYHWTISKTACLCVSRFGRHSENRLHIGQRWIIEHRRSHERWPLCICFDHSSLEIDSDLQNTVRRIEVEDGGFLLRDFRQKGTTSCLARTACRAINQPSSFRGNVGICVLEHKWTPLFSHVFGTCVLMEGYRASLCYSKSREIGIIDRLFSVLIVIENSNKRCCFLSVEQTLLELYPHRRLKLHGDTRLTRTSLLVP